MHISVLLACMALVKAVGYVLARYNLDLSQNGYVQGAGYTDVHARLPALTLLIWISLLAAVILLINIRRRGWALPVLGVGLWAFVAVVVGAIYPAIVQAVKVNPAQNNLEQPYIARNIAATAVRHRHQQRDADDVQRHPDPDTRPQVVANQPTLDNVQLWDPTQTAPTYTKLQATKSYYSFNTLAVDRYKVERQLASHGGRRPPGERQRPSLPGMGEHPPAVHPRLRHDPGAVQPDQQRPARLLHLPGPARHQPRQRPRITQPRVYFGLSNPNGGDVDYVLADTRQPEIDYQATGRRDTR